MGTVKEGLCCGIVWTQFSDIEQEANGLYTYDRQAKLPAQQVKKVLATAAEAYFENRHGR